MGLRYKAPEWIFEDINYDHYIVQYDGDIVKEVTKYPNSYVTIINEKYAILTVGKNVEINLENLQFETIVYVKPAEMFTLQEITPVEASQASFLQLNLPLNLTGKGVNVAIIDTGIDYLSEEFIDEKGETRIELIWDQSILSNKEDNNKVVPFGIVYSKNQIQDAINAHRQGKDPYEIVPSKDIIGHGTNMSGIIGGRGVNPELKGVAPDCDFIVIRLLEDYSFKAQFGISIPIFNITVIFAALEFLNKYLIIDYKPTIIYFPLGSNLGTHKGVGILDQFIESVCMRSGVAFVTGAGNQRVSGEHTSGTILGVGESSLFELDVSPDQKDIWIEIWVEAPNIASLTILSPSGESTGVINPIINTFEVYEFIVEKSSIKINYFFPEESAGDQLMRVRFYNLQKGIWTFILTGNSILDGKYNAWIPQAGITIGQTTLMPADPYGTVTNPGNGRFVITAAGYNQNNNNIINYSGMAFKDNYVNVIDVAAGAVNAITVAPSNTIAVVNGTSVSAAVVAGASALLFQWGIIDKNDPLMYSQTLKTYIARGTVKRSGDVYPNPQWGYGILNILTLFQNITS